MARMQWAGVINIVTRKQQDDGSLDMQVGYGSYNTLQTEFSNRVKKGRFSSIVTGSLTIVRTDIVPIWSSNNMEDTRSWDMISGSSWKLWGDVNITHSKMASNPGTIQVPLIDNDSRITRGMTSLAAENHYEKTSGGFEPFL